MTLFFNKGLLTSVDSRSALLETWKWVMAYDTLENWNLKMVKASITIRLKAAELTKNQRKKMENTYLPQFEEMIAA